MKSNVCALLLIFLFTGNSLLRAQLLPGDITFLGFQSDNPDALAFVTLADIPQGTTLFLTDNGWNGSALFNNENTMQWSSTSFVPAGTVVTLIMDGPLATGPNAHLIGPGTTVGKLNGLSTAGDQVLAYVGSTSNPQFIAAISSSNFISECNSTSGGANNAATCLPPPLVLGVNALAFTNSSVDFDNGFFNLTTVSGSAEEIRAIIMNLNNWTTNNDPAIAGQPQWPNWQFTVAGSGNTFVNFIGNSVTLFEGGEPQAVNISITPPAQNVGSVQVQIGQFGGITPADYVTVPAHNNGFIELPVTIGMNQVSFSIQALDDGIPEGNESGSIIISAANPYLIGSNNSLVLLIQEAPSGSSLISFQPSHAERSLLESAGVVQFNIEVFPASSTLQTFDVSIAPGPGFTPADFTLQGPINGAVMSFTLSPGETGKSFSLLLVDDNEVEGTESISFTLHNLSAGLALGLHPTAVLNVIDNDLPTPPTQLFINEVHPHNTSGIANPDGETADWIELYNPTSAAVDLAGLYLSNESNLLSKYQFPFGSAETVIPAMGFKVIWADGSPVGTGALRANFILNNDGGSVHLTAADGEEIIDEVEYPALPANMSWARTTDGGNTWAQLAPTPGASNITVGVASLSQDAFWTAYPNPVQDQLYIRFAQAVGGEISLLNTLGQTLFTQPLSNENPVQTIDLSAYPAGMYLLRLHSVKGHRCLIISKP